MTLTFEVVFSPEAEAQLVAIHEYVSQESSHSIADRFVGGIAARCESLERFPHRGTPHDALRNGLRTIPFRRRTTIAYIVSGGTVLIVAVLYAGQDISKLAEA